LGLYGAVDIAARYALDGPVIESRWDFPQGSRPLQWITQPPTQWEVGLCNRGNAAGAWRWQEQRL